MYTRGSFSSCGRGQRGGGGTALVSDAKLYAPSPLRRPRPFPGEASFDDEHPAGSAEVGPDGREPFGPGPAPDRKHQLPRTKRAKDSPIVRATPARGLRSVPLNSPDRFLHGAKSSAPAVAPNPRRRGAKLRMKSLRTGPGRSTAGAPSRMLTIVPERFSHPAVHTPHRRLTCWTRPRQVLSNAPRIPAGSHQSPNKWVRRSIR